MKRSTSAALLASALMLYINACAPLPGTASSPNASASATITARPSPSPTPSPLPAAPTSPASTLAPPSPAASSVAGRALDCKLNWQSPVNGTKFEPRSDFTVRWNVTNTGTEAWDAGTVELVYAGGTRMYFQPVIPLAESVAPGQSATLTVDMKALRNTSSYVTTWALRRGETYFCTLSSMIYVQWLNDSERNW